MSGKIRWLHLSDIHYMIDPNATNIQGSLFAEMQRYFKNNSNAKVDYVVITGDFLQHGEYIYKNQFDCIKFIDELCHECLKLEYMNVWKQHVFFCPGNHDLNREASYNDKTRKKIHRRGKVLKNLINSSPNRMSESDAEQYDLLTEDSFWLFDETIGKEILGDGYKKYGEYKVFKGCVADDQYGANIRDEKHQVVFVGLNTALYAGQMRDKEEIKQDIDIIRKKMADAERGNFPQTHENASQNSLYEQAVEDYKRYLNLHYELIDGNADDKGKLCFLSVKSEDTLTKSIEEIGCNSEDPIVILFGHHPLEWLTVNAQKNFASWAKHKGYGAKLYLCGHEHKPRLHDYFVEFDGDASYQLIELGIGGDLADKSGWNVLSFSINTIEFQECGDVDFSGEIACMCKYIDNNLIKYTENETYGWQYFQFKGIKLREGKTSPDLDVQNIIKQQKNIEDIREEKRNIVDNPRDNISQEIINPRNNKIVYTSDMLDKNIDF